MELGNKILNLRKKAGYSQEVLAEKLDVTRQTISNWECGQTTPDIIQAKSIAKIFHISLDELTDNNIENILLERISNTENLTNKIVKILKVLGVILIASIVSFMIIIISLSIYNYKISKKEYSYVMPETKTKTIFCYLNENIYEYQIKYEENNKVFSWVKNSIVTQSEEDFEKETVSFEEVANKNAIELIEYIKSFYKERGGICEEVDENQRIEKYKTIFREK